MRVADAAVNVSLVGLPWAMIIKIPTGIKARSEMEPGAGVEPATY